MLECFFPASALFSYGDVSSAGESLISRANSRTAFINCWCIIRLGLLLREVTRDQASDLGT